MIRYLVVPLCLAAVSCPPPQPTPTPTPQPTPTVPSPVCQPGQTCGCWHQPPGQEWQKLPDCPQPTPTPTPALCTLPVPPKVGKWGGPKPHNQWFDSTPKFYNGNAPMWDGSVVTGYCTAIGVNELWCPARVEGDPQRLPCERIGVSGSVTGRPLWRCGVGQVEVNPENIFQARCGAGALWIEVCAADGTACSRTAL